MYETASLEETSADEVALKSPQSEDDSDKKVEVFRENATAKDYDNIKELSQ